MQQVFRVKAKKQEVGKEMVVPFHPELVFTEKLDNDSWRAKNILSDEVVVRRVENGDFYEYEIE